MIDSETETISQRHHVVIQHKSKEIQVHSSELGCKIAGVSDEISLLDEIFEQFLESAKLNEEKRLHEATLILFEIGKKIKRSEYLDSNLSLITKNASRFRYIEVIGEIEKIIPERNGKKAEEIFESEEYSFLRKLWKPSISAFKFKSNDIRIEFLEYFYSFLILNHQ